jgi:hypothetical protein
MNFIRFGNTGGAFTFDGVSEIVQDPLTGVAAFRRNTNSVNFTHEIYEGSDESFEEIKDQTTSDETVNYQTFDNVGRRFKDGATLKTFGDSITDEYIIQNDGTTIFKIYNDGRIGTNQLKAAVVRIVHAHDIPVYDTAGVLHGYIKVFT